MGAGRGMGMGRGRGKFSGKKCRLIAMFCLTTIFFLVEIITGYATNSMALVADSFHMLSDIAALVIAFLSVRMAPKSWSQNTFGWARAEVLGALINAVFLVALCFSITVESMKRFYEPEPIKHAQMVLYVGALGLAVNLVGLCLFHEHGSSHGHSHGLSSSGGHAHHNNHQHNPHPSTLESCNMEVVPRSTHSHLTDLADKDEKGANNISEIVYPGVEPKVKKKKSGGHGHSHGGSGNSAANMNMRGVWLHVMADALGSVIVIISALIMWLGPDSWKWKIYVDPGLSLLLVILILKSVWPLLIDSALILLQTVPVHIEVDMLQRKLMEKVEGILAVHEFHVWQLTGDRIIASAHIRCLNPTEYMEIAEKVKEFFHLEGIHSTTIQPEFVETESSSSMADTEDCVLACPQPCLPSKCCPPVTKASSTGQVAMKSRSRQTSPASKKKRPSIVSITKETGQGMNGLIVGSPNRRSAPNLSVNEPSPENTVEMTAELNLSDSNPSSNNSSFRQDAPLPRPRLGSNAANSSPVSNKFSSTPAKPNHVAATTAVINNRYAAAASSLNSSGLSQQFNGIADKIGGGGGGQRILSYSLDKNIGSGRTDSSYHEEDDHFGVGGGGLSDSEEHTPMVPRTKTRIVKTISKQSDV